MKSIPEEFITPDCCLTQEIRNNATDIFTLGNQCQCVITVIKEPEFESYKVWYLHTDGNYYLLSENDRAVAGDASKLTIAVVEGEFI